MPLAALILANFEEEGSAAAQPLLLTLGGQTLLERLVDQACRIGAGHVIVCAGPLPATLLSAVDRLKARGVDVTLARAPREAADFLHPDEDVLVFATAFVMQDDPLQDLVALAAPAILTLPEAWGRDRFERIDAIDNWAGVALLPARIVRDTVAMLGDWAFGPTLIRRAIQQGVIRRPLGLTTEDETDEIAPLVKDDLVGTASAIIRTAIVPTDGVFERLVLLPPLRRIAFRIALKPISPNMTGLAALVLYLGAVGLAGFGFAELALLSLVLGGACALLTGLIGQISTPERRFLSRPLEARHLFLPAVLLALAGRLVLVDDPGQPVVLLLLWLAVQALLTVHAAARGGPLPLWRLGAAGEALLLAISFGAGWPVIGLLFILALKIGVQASLQDKMHRS